MNRRFEYIGQTLGFLKKMAGRLLGQTGAVPAHAVPRSSVEQVEAEAHGARAADKAKAAGNAALDRRAYDEAVTCFAAAIDVRHDDASAYCGLGIAQFKLGQKEDAADSLQMALHFSANAVEPRYYLALLAQREGELSAAIDYAMGVLQRQPDHADACNLIGACWLASGNAARAAEFFSRAVELKPGEASYQSNLGYVLVRDLGEFERGRAHLETALRLDPDDFAARCNYCSVLNQEGRTDEVIAVCSDLLLRYPDMNEARLNRALALLRRQRFAEGWQDYEARKATRSNYLPRPYRFPAWDGEPLSGKSILVYGEQGLGDEIMFASCFGEVIRQAARCFIDCSPKLEALFARTFPDAVVRGVEQAGGDASWVQAVGQIDFQIAAGSLTRIFRNAPGDFPAHNGYLRSDPSRAENWRRQLNAGDAKLKVGIAWRGGMMSTRRSQRSLDLHQLLPILKTPGVGFVSLQHDAAADEVMEFAARESVPLMHFPSVAADLDEAAALIASLDLVITVCGSVVHLSGGLGRAAWVMVPAVAEWRYLDSGASMPWYPSVRMFRQRKAGEWDAVIAEIAAQLADAVAHR